jgi:hypothetical protein
MAPNSGHVQWDWLATDSIHADTPLDDYDGFWCVPASPYNMDGALGAFVLPANNSGLSSAPAAVFNTPCWNMPATCWAGRMPNMARHRRMLPRAVLTPLACSLVEAIDSIHLVEGSLIAKAYETSEIREGYRCRLRCESAVRTSIADPSLHAVGHDSAGDLRAIELTTIRSLSPRCSSRNARRSRALPAAGAGVHRSLRSNLHEAERAYFAVIFTSTAHRG